MHALHSESDPMHSYLGRELKQTLVQLIHSRSQAVGSKQRARSRSWWYTAQGTAYFCEKVTATCMAVTTG